MKGLGDDGDATRDSDGDATRDSDSPVVAKDLSEAMSGANTIESKSPAASPSGPQSVPAESAKPPANSSPVVIGGGIILALSFGLVLPLPIELPSVELPSVELPSVELPSVELPSIEVDGVSDKIRGISAAVTEALRSALP